MLSQPFYGLFLMSLNKQWNDIVPTAGVAMNGINYQLLLNEDFWQFLTAEQHKGLLQHELMHIAFFHLTDFEQLKDRDLSNIAKDIEINQYIDKSIIPPGACLPETFPELNLEAKQGTTYYYQKLVQGARDKSCPNLNNLLEAMKNSEKTFKIMGGDREGNVPDHSTWKEVEGADSVTKKLLKSQTEHVLKEVAEQVIKSRGTIPGEMSEILKKITELDKPAFDWRGYLRRFVGGSAKVEVKVRRSKPNFRFEDNPGIKIKQKRKILVAIDTSGSVSTTELNEFLHQIHHISKTGTEVTIIQCDTAITSISTFDPKSEFKIHGRGGTDFSPVTDYYDEHRSKFNCLIYLTDGEAPAPQKCRGPVLWVISSHGTINEHLKGTQIKMN